MAGTTKKATKLHYDKDALLEEYKRTYVKIITIGAAFIFFILLYFFALATYLGGWSHTPHEDFVEQFGDRIDIEYDGLKLTDPKPEAAHH